MNSKVLKLLLVLGVILLVGGLALDGVYRGDAFGDILSTIAVTSIVPLAFVAALFLLGGKKAAKPAAQAVAKPVSTQPVFAHVPGPGEPGYDPTYDPDDDKYWRRYY